MGCEALSRLVSVASPMGYLDRSPERYQDNLTASELDSGSDGTRTTADSRR